MGKRPRLRAGRRPVGQPLVSPLERRLLMCVQHADFDAAVDAGVGFFPAVQEAPALGESNALGAGGIAAAGLPLSSIPALSSRPSAVAKLFLDFDGDVTSRWGAYAPGTTPAYDGDGDPTTFTSTELALIEDVWERVAEKYSPFNLDVTTVDPGNRNDFQTLRVVIGGAGAWFGPGAGGVAYIGGFTNSASNTVFVFSGNLGNSGKAVAEAAAHESGHGFGLQHQGLWTGTTLTAEYHPGVEGAAPIMGASYTAPRGQWWHGTPSSSSTARQDDLAIISSTGTNRFGYRVDDVGNAAAGARPLAVNGAAVSSAGVIEQMSDVDVFSFSSGAGAISVNVAPVPGGMLDAKVELRNVWGGLVAASDSELGETLNVNVTAGTYYLSVASHGRYGDVGQYTVSGTIVPPTPGISAPTGLAALAGSSRRINLSWTDNASNETVVEVQRSSDGGATWSIVASLSADSMSYVDTSVVGGASYGYRVLAHNGEVASVHSNTAWVTTPPDAPTSVTAAAASPTEISLVWSDVAGEAGYRIERWAEASGWVTVGTVGPNVTSFVSTHLSDGVLHYHRVVAIGAAGEAAASQAVAATTPAAPQASASFAGNDYTTKGAWTGVRGSEGYVIPGLSRSLPSYLTFSANGTAPLSFGATSDPRALQVPGWPQSRWSSRWDGPGPMSFDFNFSDGVTHRLSMYLLDSDRVGAAMLVRLTDAGSGKVLAQQPVSGLEEGRYLSWDVKGPVRVWVSSIGTGQAGVAGFFIDRPPAAAAVVAAPMPVIPAPSSPAAGGLFSYASILDWYRQQVRLRRGSVLTL